MSQLIAIGVLLGGVVAGLLAFAPQVSESLVRARARRLPPALAERMEEEWLAEVDALDGRASQLAFAIALTLTRRHSFAMEEDIVATIGGWPSVVVVATLSFAAIAYGASFLIQPVYRATARIRVVPSRMPKAFVEATVRLPWQDRLQHTNAQVLSQSSLEPIILDAHLYGVNRTDGARALVSTVVVERMRQDTDVRFLPDGESFEVGYRSPDPQVARTVAGRLLRLYIQLGLEDRATADRVSRHSLDAHIDAIRSRLLHQAAIRSAVGRNAPDVKVRRLEHEQLRSLYRELLVKREHVLTTTLLEQRAFGEHFQLIDPPDLPSIPISPNRRLIAGEGAAAGFLLAVTMMLAGRTASLQRFKKAQARS